MCVCVYVELTELHSVHHIHIHIHIHIYIYIYTCLSWLVCGMCGHFPRKFHTPATREIYKYLNILTSLHHKGVWRCMRRGRAKQ